MTERRIEYMPLADLAANPANPKEHVLADLDDSISRFGYVEPVVLDERTGMLIAGHGRTETLIAREQAGGPPPDGVELDADGVWLVPVVRGWASSDDREASAMLIASNRLTEKGGWHDENLTAILADLASNPLQLDGDPFAGIGYTADEFAALLAGPQPDDTGSGTGATRASSTWEPDPPVARDQPVTVQILEGDSLELLKSLPDESIDSVVCDPPYGLEFMGKDWDTFRIDDRSARWAGSESGGGGAGFAESEMGQLPAFGKRRTTSTCLTCGKRDAFRNPHACDRTDPPSADWHTIPVDVVPIEMRAFQNWCTLWAVELYRVLKPGGHLLAFGGSRTYHRLASGIEDAGFDVRDSLHFMHGQGFPKSLDIAKAIDARAGHVRGAAGPVKSGNTAMGGPNYERTDKGDPVTAAAAAWDGWGTALKPAHEPIVLARKHLDGSTVATVLKYGTGGLNIGATRTGTEERTNPAAANVPGGSSLNLSVQGMPVDADPTDAVGRWPANILLQHGDDCTADGCAEGCAVAYLDAQSGESSSPDKPMKSGGVAAYAPGADKTGMKPSVGYGVGYGDAGGASRFMPTFAYGPDDAELPVFFYTPKPSTAERNAGLEGLPEREVNDQLDPGDPGYDNPRAGAGRGGAQANYHPTVKSVALMRWLVRLVTPPGGTVLDPFAGSGSTLVAAVLEGFDAIGMEKTADYLPILEARVEWAQGRAAAVTRERLDS